MLKLLILCILVAAVSCQRYACPSNNTVFKGYGTSTRKFKTGHMGCPQQKKIKAL